MLMSGCEAWRCSVTACVPLWPARCTCGAPAIPSSSTLTSLALRRDVAANRLVGAIPTEFGLLTNVNLLCVSSTTSKVLLPLHCAHMHSAIPAHARDHGQQVDGWKPSCRSHSYGDWQAYSAGRLVCAVPLRGPDALAAHIHALASNGIHCIHPAPQRLCACPPVSATQTYSRYVADRPDSNGVRYAHGGREGSLVRARRSNYRMRKRARRKNTAHPRLSCSHAACCCVAAQHMRSVMYTNKLTGPLPSELGRLSKFWELYAYPPCKSARQRRPTTSAQRATFDPHVCRTSSRSTSRCACHSLPS